MIGLIEVSAIKGKDVSSETRPGPGQAATRNGGRTGPVATKLLHQGRRLARGILCSECNWCKEGVLSRAPLPMRMHVTQIHGYGHDRPGWLPRPVFAVMIGGYLGLGGLWPRSRGDIGGIIKAGASWDSVSPLFTSLACPCWGHLEVGCADPVCPRLPTYAQEPWRKT